MPRIPSIAFVILVLPLLMPAQDDLIVFRSDAAGALVWGEDSPAGAVSSSIRNPLTGHAVRKLVYRGVEVSSQAGFERIGSGQAGEFLSFAITVINNRGSDLVLHQGGISVDGHIASPVPVVLTTKGLSKSEQKQIVELSKMKCFSSGLLPDQLFVSPKTDSNTFTVPPKRALTLSFVAKDPRFYPILCSVEGCHPKGTIRVLVTVNATDYVFVWPGRDMVHCDDQ
jgi:hypothetical protein